MLSGEDVQWDLDNNNIIDHLVRQRDTLSAETDDDDEDVMWMK